MLKRLLVFGVLMVCAQASRAVVVQFDHVTGVDWFYNILLDPGTSLRANANPSSTAQNGFTVYDFPGLVAAEFTPDAAVADRTFALTQPGVGFTPPGIAPTVDNPLLDNVSVRLDSGDEIVPVPSAGSLLLGTLKLTGASGLPGLPVEFSGQSIQQRGDTPLGNWSTTAGPIPEPSTVGLMGAGLAAVAAFALRRRKTQR